MENDRSSRRALVLVVVCWSIGGGVARAQATEHTLHELLAFADAHAPELVLAEARAVEGVAAREGASPLLRDPLRFEFGVGPRVQDNGQAVDLDFTLAVSQGFDFASQRGARLDAADRLFDQRGAEIEVIRWSVHRDVHFAFHEAVEARLRLAAEEAWIVFADRLLAIAQARLDAGDASELDVAMATAEVSRAHQRRVAAAQQLRDVTLRLCEISGWPASDAPLPVGGFDTPGAIPSDAALIARALDQQPELAARRAAVALASAEVTSADRDAFPVVDFGLSFVREGAAGGPANYIGLVTFGVSLPFFDANTSARATARARLTIADAELAALEALIDARVRRAASALRSASERIAIYQSEVLPGFENNLNMLRTAFELGEIDALAASAGRQRLLEVQSDALDAIADYHRALAELESQLGGEITPDEAHESPAPTSGDAS